MLPTEASKPCTSCGHPLEPSGECNICLMQLGMSQNDAPEPSNVAPMPSIEELNAQFPNLEITRLVGRGGMGAIYHARQTSLDRDVALKLIAKEFSSDPAFLERFEREAKTLAKLSHPNIVTIFDYGHTADGIAYLVLEYVDGINLREAIKAESVESDEALEIVSTICNALEYAHSKGVVHRDVKPENILLGEDGTLKVADFGIAKILDNSVPTPTLTATRQVLGSLHYLAPEHLEAPDQVDHRVDLYAVGVIFYELLTGQLPLGRYEPPSRVSRRVDQRLDGIVMKTLNRRPHQRYQTAAELDSDIEDVATSVKNQPAPEPAGQTNQPQGNRSANSQTISVPFTNETMEGLAQVIGVVGVRNGCLYAEYRVRDAIFGQVKSKTHVIEIPRKNLTRVELVRGILGSKLVITTDTISVLGDFPDSETGRVALKVKRVDESAAREITHALGFDSVQTVDRQVDSGPLRWPNEPADSERQLFGLLMILCGILNAAVIAVGAFLMVGVLNDSSLAFVLVWGILLGALAILQFVTGIISLVGPARSLGLFTAFASMVPITPLWLLSCPVGIWLYRRSKASDPSPGLAVDSTQGIGATTMMLLRESRTARLTSGLGTVAAILLLVGLGCVRTGYYTRELHYRIVDTSVDWPELVKAMQVRLGGADGFRSVKYSEHLHPTQITVEALHRYRDDIDAMIRVQDVPSVVWLRGTGEDSIPSSPESPGNPDATMTNGTLDDSTAAESSETSVAANTPPAPKTPDNPSGTDSIPIVEGIDPTGFATTESTMGRSLQAMGAVVPLQSSWVGEVTTSDSVSDPTLTIELTAEGRKQLAELLQGQAAGLGLVVDGLVEGIAKPDTITQRRIEFQLSAESEVTSKGIAAGIRGPGLPSPLERLR